MERLIHVIIVVYSADALLPRKRNSYGCGVSVSISAVLTLPPAERTTCSILFSLTVSGSYETCSTPCSVLVSITPFKVATASMIFFAGWMISQVLDFNPCHHRRRQAGIIPRKFLLHLSEEYSQAAPSVRVLVRIYHFTEGLISEIAPSLFRIP